ncbi:MAG TPA: ATP-binding protein [Cyclobacteriaceae bacterium]|nr:GHKL domain-containing protein [Cyclobacteriaceae bacterium]HMV10047.1 ATP-binding protein [Cyclobacteriaceae bacterium]HMV89974.1 ATP-binding protein [Cyclobacteriaceae bacterium]HMW99818.1 ATP-binding protein [Cyclobacteriaceae bacterium]HMX50210.1 ATP-binding protein [Cyclobacteriaceae bacterium]
MDFNWKSPVLPRVAILAFSILLFGYLLFSERQYVISIVLLAVILFQVKQMMKMIESSNYDMASFLDSIKFDDLSSTFKTDSKDPSIQRLHNEMNEALVKLRYSRQERDSEYLFYKNIVMHVGIGLIIFKEDTGKIEIFNSAARKLLKVNRAETVNDLKEVSETLVNVFTRLRTGGRELLRLKVGEDFIQLSVYAIELTLRGENLKLISLQNIQSELEEKEMEAWQNLVRVLTHEIMNSVTPISSLAGIVEDEIRIHLRDDAEKPLQKEQLADIHLSLQTISKRSEGLIHFVKEFRSLTHIPKPKPENIRVAQLFDEVAMLHKSDLSEKNIKLECKVDPSDLTISADKTMIEQVVINLFKNAIQAFDDGEEKLITLRAYYNEKMRPVISVKDNGTGIDPEALEKIFIPFFTTKKSGSGIGLSLSRQIMRQHQGTLTVKSTVGKGTEFLMRF